jgi:queuine tRNA-ribosyltransferase
MENKSRIFKIKYKDKKTKARVAILKTKSGKIETPFFMPVATKTSVKQLSSEDLKKIGCKAVISNTFILHLRPGEQLINKLGGIKKFMNFKGINVTDSGGFQMYSPTLYISSNEKGVNFKNPFTKEKIFITPEKDMQIQLDLDSDIAMCLDTMPLIEHSKEEIKVAVNKTTEWAERCKKYHSSKQKLISPKKKQILFAITQGGIHKELREKSARELKKLNFEGYSIGGLALGETIEQELKMIKVHKKIIGEEKPCYLMGAGNPVEILEAISLGVDMFDSRFPTQNARHGTLLTSNGKLRIFRKIYELDKKPIDEECSCFVCKNYSRAYIRYQLLQEEAVGMRLATYHNIHYITALLKEARREIKKGTFIKFKNNIKKIYKKAEKGLKKNN